MAFPRTHSTVLNINITCKLISCGSTCPLKAPLRQPPCGATPTHNHQLHTQTHTDPCPHIHILYTRLRTNNITYTCTLHRHTPTCTQRTRAHPTFLYCTQIDTLRAPQNMIAQGENGPFPRDPARHQQRHTLNTHSINSAEPQSFAASEASPKGAHCVRSASGPPA